MIQGHNVSARILPRSPEGESNVYPHYFVEDPRLIPAGHLGKRKVIPRLRVLIDAVADPDLRDANPVRWAVYAIALGKFLDRHRDECFGTSVQHNIGKRRSAYLDLYIGIWDSICEEA